MRKGFVRFSREHEGRAQAIMRKRQARIEIESELEFGNGGRIFSSQIARASQSTMRSCIIAVERNGLLGGFDGALAIVVRRFGESIDDFVVIGLGGGGIGRTEVRVGRNRCSKLLACFGEIVLSIPIEVDHAALDRKSTR